MNAVGLLSGLGCDCRGSMGSLAAVADFDQIKIGGKTYTVNQILDKTLIAAVDTKIYSGAKGTPTVLGTIKAGQPLGKVYSYLRPDQTGDGRSWLMFEGSANSVYYAPNEAASGTGLKDQGALTVAEEIKKEEEEKERLHDPISYYFKKFGWKVILIGGGIYLAAQLGKEAVKAKLT